MPRILRKAVAALSEERDRLKLDEATTGSLTREAGTAEHHPGITRAGRGATVNSTSRPHACRRSVDLRLDGDRPHGAVLRGVTGHRPNRTRSSSRRRQSIRLLITQNRTGEAEDIFRAGIRGRNRIADDWIETETAFFYFDVG